MTTFCVVDLGGKIVGGATTRAFADRIAATLATQRRGPFRVVESSNAVCSLVDMAAHARAAMDLPELREAIARVPAERVIEAMAGAAQ